MGRYGFCWDEREHRDEARRDARYDRPDRDYYDRYTTDPCKDAYTEEYDRERRRIEEREEQERQEREAEERRYYRRLQEEAEQEPEWE